MHYLINIRINFIENKNNVSKQLKYCILLFLCNNNRKINIHRCYSEGEITCLEHWTLHLENLHVFLKNNVFISKLAKNNR